jgi:phage tail-like protein
MALPDLDSSVGYSFGLEFDGVTIKQITEVSGLKVRRDVGLEQDPDGGNLLVRKLPGRLKAGEVTLTRGLTQDAGFETWLRDSGFGRRPDVRKGGAIIVYDYEGTTVGRYQLVNPRLKALKRGIRKPGDTSVLTERLILTHEGSRLE